VKYLSFQSAVAVAEAVVIVATHRFVFLNLTALFLQFPSPNIAFVYEGSVIRILTNIASVLDLFQKMKP
jgi:hypothetical protein